MKYLFWGFVLIAFYKFANNLSLLLRTIYYSKKYDAYLRNIAVGFTTYIPMVTKLFETAGVVESYFAVAESVGYGYIHTEKVPHFLNMANRREDIVGATLRSFGQAKAIFRSRLIETFSPLFWIRTLLFLPRHLFLYLGVKADSVFVKIVQVIYWIATPLLIAFRDNIYHYLAMLLS
jgi:hypothetical protein